ncbi:sensor histidine kinase [Thermomonas sp.]|uniref:sensor histidine kinase n=1 Tax=Thermomonas sp. TaxID=1971895 RepID=UPI0035B1E005
MRRLLPSTSTRLALLVMGFFLAAVVVIGGGVYVAVSTLLLRDARELVHADTIALTDTYRDGGRAALLAELRSRIDGGEGDPDAVYALADANGRALLGQLPEAREPGMHGRWVEFSERAPEGAPAPRVIGFERRLPGGELLLAGQRLQSEDRLLALMQQAAVLALLVAVTLGALVGWLTSRWVSRRLRSLDATAARVGAGELGLRVPLDRSGDAFDQLAQRFNAMLDRIEELLEGVRHATDHIAHDLRTPLTRLRNRLEDLRQHAPEAASRQGLAQALAETDQLLQAFAALLRLARIEAQPADATAPALDLRGLIDDAADMYGPVAAERGLRIVQAGGAATVRGDRDQLFQLVVNLLDNALKHAPPGSDVELALDATPEGVRLQVADRGTGIPVADRDRVFDRFLRLEAHRGTPGVGLGLSLVRAIARHHGGRVALLDNAPGLRVVVLLPAA